MARRGSDGCIPDRRPRRRSRRLARPLRQPVCVLGRAGRRREGDRRERTRPRLCRRLGNRAGRAPRPRAGPRSATRDGRIRFRGPGPLAPGVAADPSGGRRRRRPRAGTLRDLRTPPPHLPLRPLRGPGLAAPPSARTRRCGGCHCGRRRAAGGICRRRGHRPVVRARVAAGVGAVHRGRRPGVTRVRGGSHDRLRVRPRRRLPCDPGSGRWRRWP